MEEHKGICRTCYRHGKALVPAAHLSGLTVDSIGATDAAGRRIAIWTGACRVLSQQTAVHGGLFERHKGADDQAGLFL